MADRQYTESQAVAIARIAVELGGEIEGIKRFGYASIEFKQLVRDMIPYADIFVPVIKNIPAEQRSKLKLGARDVGEINRTSEGLAKLIKASE